MFNRKKMNIDFLKKFPLYTPNSGGSHFDKSKLTIDCISILPFALSHLTEKYIDIDVKYIVSSDISLSESEKETVSNLSSLFKKYGSDKSTTHNYHIIYGKILDGIDNKANIFEIGLGTNNNKIVSNMGGVGYPGSSLRAFKELKSNFSIYGADYDKEILFEEERIKTFFVDQTKPETFLSLSDYLPNKFDLMIDDGLHSPHANIYSLSFFLSKLN
jgi:hypothetical protein